MTAPTSIDTIQYNLCTMVCQLKPLYRGLTEVEDAPEAPVNDFQKGVC